MAYAGYLLKIGDYTIPKKFFKPQSYSPYVNMQDVEDYTDANGYLHRNPVELKASKVEFETPAMLTQIDLNELLGNIRENIIGEAGRELYFTAYIPEYDDYVTQKGYLADFKPQMYYADNTTIKYNSIKFSVIGGVYDG